MAKPKFSIGLPVLVNLRGKRKRIKGVIIDGPIQYPNGWYYTVFLEKPIGGRFLEIKEQDIKPLRKNRHHV